VTFSEDAWRAAGPWFEAILRHPFLDALTDGSLPEATFVRYLVDDAHYLERYARVLALIATRASDPAGTELFAAAAGGAIAAERALHHGFLAPRGLDPDLDRGRGERAVPEPSPTCLAYTGYLLELASSAPVAVAIAGVLPCFRVYAEVGAAIQLRRPNGEHVYAAWIDTYAAAEFEHEVRRVEAYVDSLPGDRAAMLDAYAAATRFEWMFWDAAWRGEAWPTREASATAAGNLSALRLALPETPPLLVKTDDLMTLGERQLRAISDAGVTLRQRVCSTEDDLIAAGAAADGLLVVGAPVTARVLGALPRCRVIGRLGVGLEMIDLTAATEAQVQVTYAPAATTDEVSDHAMALLLALSRRILQLDAAVRAGTWHHDLEGRDVRRIRDQVVGVIGCGRIGAAFARKVGALGPTVLAHDPEVADADVISRGVQPVGLDELLRQSDYVSLHVPLTAGTRHLIGARELALMKPTAQLINVARGGLVDQAALVDALQRGVIAGAALDVLEDEPPDGDDPLLALDNVLLSPHAAYYSLEAIEETLQTVVEDVLAVLRGGAPRFPANQPAT
jgi:phosphoglycerate dehydrogenase-like enzyme/thiaminase